MVVKDQQVTAVVHRRRGMFRNNLPAQRLPFAAVVGRHQRYGMPRFSRCTHQRERRSPRQGARNDAEFRIRTIQAKRPVTAMNHQILQLHRATAGNARREQGFVQVPASRQQVVAHEHAAHNVVDERRMDSVAAEITGAGKPVAQFGNPPGQPEGNGMSDDLHSVYFFSKPARRPVEKAIWRL